MSLNICEIFYSLQGESTYYGLPCIFIRLSGCNLRCSWCDTTYTWSNGKEMSIEQILQEIRKYPCSLVEITGGEPLLRKDIELCGREIRKRGMRWSMVSNGYLYDNEKHISLLNAGLGALTISIDGLESSHNWLRNNDKSFERVDIAIGLAASSSRLNS